MSFTFRPSRNLSPGDKVKIFGSLRAKARKPFRKNQLMLYNTEVHVNSIEKLNKNIDDFEITEEELRKFKALAKDKNIVKNLADSFCKNIVGLENVKATILLALFSGEEKKSRDSTTVRSHLNILLIGETSTGKSQLLREVGYIFPRSIYTTGKSSSTAGITATVTRDPDTGEYFLEAGAMVLADRGIVMIDEFEKLDKINRFAIREAMKQETVFIKKAGIVSTLQSRTGVIAATNPTFGIYDKNVSVLDNINFGAQILSYFDLILVLVGEANEQTDRLVAKHILGIHDETEESILSVDELKKYIFHAKKNIFPKLSASATKVLKDFYVNFRNNLSCTEENKISSLKKKQLESLIRLSQARAKMSFEKRVTKKHAQFAIDLMKKTFVLWKDESPDQLYTQFSSKNLDKVNKVLAVIRKLTIERKNKLIEFKKIRKEALKLGLSEENITEILNQLLRSGCIYSSRSEHYGLLQ